jgi:hypothetical protein
MTRGVSTFPNFPMSCKILSATGAKRRFAPDLKVTPGAKSRLAPGGIVSPGVKDRFAPAPNVLPGVKRRFTPGGKRIQYTISVFTFFSATNAVFMWSIPVFFGHKSSWCELILPKKPYIRKDC